MKSGNSSHACSLRVAAIACAVGLSFLSGCTEPDSELGKYSFPNGETVRIVMSFKNPDPDIAWGGNVRAFFNVSDEAEYITLIKNDPEHFELEKIPSEDGNCVCFYAKNFSENEILFVVDSTESENMVSHPFKRGYSVEKKWGQSINKKITALKNEMKNKQKVRGTVNDP